MSIFVGYLFKDMVAGVGSNSTLSAFNDFSLNNSKALWVEYLPQYLKIILNISSFSGFFYYFLIHVFSRNGVNLVLNKNKKSQLVYDFFLNRWKLDSIVTFFSNYFFMFIYKDRSSETVYSRLVDKFTVRVISNASSTINSIYGSTVVLTPFQYVSKSMVYFVLFGFFGSLANDLYIYC